MWYVCSLHSTRLSYADTGPPNPLLLSCSFSLPCVSLSKCITFSPTLCCWSLEIALHVQHYNSRCALYIKERAARARSLGCHCSCSFSLTLRLSFETRFVFANVSSFRLVSAGSLALLSSVGALLSTLSALCSRLCFCPIYSSATPLACRVRR